MHFHGCPLWKTENPAKAQSWRGFAFLRVDFGSRKTRILGPSRPVLALYSPKSLDERGQHPHARLVIDQGLTSVVTIPFFYRSAGAIWHPNTFYPVCAMIKLQTCTAMRSRYRNVWSRLIWVARLRLSAQRTPAMRHRQWHTHSGPMTNPPAAHL